MFITCQYISRLSGEQLSPDAPRVTTAKQPGYLDLSLDAVLEEATVRQLHAALVSYLHAVGECPLCEPPALWIDGTAALPELVLAQAGLRPGSVVHLDPETARRTFSAGSPRQPQWLVEASGGLHSGRRRGFADAVLMIGRTGTCGFVLDDPTVSPQHARLTVSDAGCAVEDLGSVNGTRIDGLASNGVTTVCQDQQLSLGAAELTVSAPPGLDAHQGLSLRAETGTSVLNRPPRPALAGSVSQVRVPDPPAEQRRSAAFSLAALIGPIVMGVVMVQLLGNIRYALFALMAPVMLVTNLIATRRRNKKDAKSSQRKFRRDLQDFEKDLDTAARLERTRREYRNPNPAEVLRRVGAGSRLLWERRSWHPDFLEFRLGRGAQRWQPPVDLDRVAAVPALSEAVRARSTIDRCAVSVSLAANGIIGLVGHRQAALALARSMILAATTHQGPADVPVAVICDSAAVGDWDWTKWLPHVRPQGQRALLFGDDESAQAFLQRMLDTNRQRLTANKHDDAPQARLPTLLLVLDSQSLLAEPDSSVREVLYGEAGPIAGLIIAPAVDQLPSVCRHVVTLADDLGDATLATQDEGSGAVGFVAAGIQADLAANSARLLARYEDPELGSGEARLPLVVQVLSMLDPEPEAPIAPGRAAALVERLWGRAPADSLRVPLGEGADGPEWVDLVSDGPHALVGGTTGSGKSEFLRSLVVSLAASYTADQVVFVLIDYKGGSAFDCCAQLPHVVGLVTDLDDHLGERALVSLDAEIGRRERLLRAQDAPDIAHYLACGSPGGPLPRLVLVVDEFATLANELPDFMGSLVSIAQRGRSLGVHLILATQRPSGVVNANIKANTSIRVALRMQDAADSSDVLDSPVAADIKRHTPGRAFVRLGPGELVAVQTPLSGASSLVPKPTLSLRPLTFASQQQAPAPDLVAGQSDLALLVSACQQAQAKRSTAPPRRPWLPMIPAVLRFGANDHGPEGLEGREGSEGTDALEGLDGFGVLDDPVNQQRLALLWEPQEAHLGMFGMVGSGTSSALVSAAMHLAMRSGPESLHMYGLDFGGGALAPLAALPHVGCVLGANETERQVLLLAYLCAEVERRRSLDVEGRAHEPQVLLLVDGLGALLGAYDGLEGMEHLDNLKAVLAEGAPLGVGIAATATRIPALPGRVAAAFGQRLLFAHSDPSDFATIGLRARDVPSFVPGRFVAGDSLLTGQVRYLADPAAWIARHGLASSVQPRQEAGSAAPLRFAPLPHRISVTAMSDSLELDDGLRVPIGVGQGNSGAVWLDLDEGDHVLVGGAPRSGVSTTLGYLAGQVKERLDPVVLVGVCSQRSPLRAQADTFDALGKLGELEAVLKLAAMDVERRWVVAVDDAHAIEDAKALQPLFGARHCHLLVGGRAQQLHGLFNHWTRHVRRNGKGLLLMPRLEADGDLLGVRLPRRLSTPMVAGRGFLVVDGGVDLVQVALDDLAVPAA